MADDDPSDQSEDLIDVGSERWALLGARLRRHPVTRLVLALGLVVVVVVAVRSVGGGFGSSGPSTAPATSPATPNELPTTAPDAAAATQAADDSLYAVPAGDLRSVLAERRCRSGCTAHSLFGRALVRAVSAFPGMTPVAGGTVTRQGGTVIFVSIEGRAEPDALVHLVLQRVSTGEGSAAPVPGAVSSDTQVDGARTVTVRQVRDGWRLRASLVVRGVAPPTAAALTWTATTKLPD